MSWFDYLLDALTVLLLVGVIVVGAISVLMQPTNYAMNTLATTLMVVSIWALSGWVKEKTSVK